MNTTMTATDLAQQFHGRGLSGAWLSRKQTDFLVALSGRKGSGASYDGMRHTWHGGWTSEAGDHHNWTLYISPINRCGLFNVSVYTQARATLEDEKRTLGDAFLKINERAMACLQANDADGMQAVYADPENRRVMERYAEVEQLLKAEEART